MTITTGILIVFILQIMQLSAGVNYLRFSSNPTVAANQSDIIMQSNDIVVDAAGIKQILIKVIADKGFKFFCQVDKLNKKFAIMDAKFCWKSQVHSEKTCKTLTKSNEPISIFQNIFLVQYDNRTGFVATKLMGGLQGYYFCEMKTSIDFISSNYVEFHNVNYYRSLILTSFTSDPLFDFRSNRTIKDSHIFEFGGNRTEDYKMVPQWIVPIVEEFHYWRICLVVDDNAIGNTYNCSSDNNRLKRDTDYFQFSNYSIRLFDHVYRRRNNFMLENYDAIRRFPISSYFILRAEIKLAQSTKRIFYFESNANEIHFREGDNSFQVNKLSVAYTGYAQTFVWSKLSLLPWVKSNKNSRDLIFPPIIKTDFEDIYMLYMFHNADLVIKLQFYVYIDAAPSVHEDFYTPHLVYRFPKQSFTMKIRIKGKNLMPRFTVNNIQVNLTDHQFSMKNVFDKYPYLSKFDFQHSLDVINNFIGITVKVKKLEKLIEQRGQFLALGFEARNPVGVARGRSMVNIIEPPKWTRTFVPGNYSTVVDSNKDYHFSCEIYSGEYSKLDFQIDYTWKIDEAIVDNDNNSWTDKYLNINGSSLVLVRSNFTDFRNITISCRVMILAPKIFMNGRQKFEKIYDSNRDLLLQKRLTANIIIGTPHRRTSSYSVQGIITIYVLIILAVILHLAVIIFLIFCICANKNKKNGNSGSSLSDTIGLTTPECRAAIRSYHY